MLIIHYFNSSVVKSIFNLILQENSDNIAKVISDEIKKVRQINISTR